MLLSLQRPGLRLLYRRPPAITNTATKRGLYLGRLAVVAAVAAAVVVVVAVAAAVVVAEMSAVTMTASRLQQRPQAQAKTYAATTDHQTATR